MSDKIFDLIKTNVLEAISNNAAVPSDKKQETVSVTTDALIGGMKDNFSLDNIPALTSLFGGKSSVESNPIVSNITNTVVGSLVEKVGLPKALAGTIASTVVPMVVKAISSKVSGSEKGFDVESLVKSFSGDSNGGGLGGMLGSLGKLFS